MFDKDHVRVGRRIKEIATSFYAEFSVDGEFIEEIGEVTMPPGALYDVGLFAEARSSIDAEIASLHVVLTPAGAPPATVISILGTTPGWTPQAQRAPITAFSMKPITAKFSLRMRLTNAAGDGAGLGEAQFRNIEFKLHYF